MEIVLVELSHETCKIAVFEVLREDGLGKSLILRDMLANARALDSRGKGMGMAGYALP